MNLQMNKMTTNQKKAFLSVDLIERMIRVEQRVSASFHKYIPYKETEYYMSLNDQEKNRFENYLKNKRKKKFVLPSFFILTLISFFAFKMAMTGNAISENTAAEYGWFGQTILLLLFVFLAVFLFKKLAGRKRDKRIDKHFYILDKALSRF